MAGWFNAVDIDIFCGLISKADRVLPTPGLLANPLDGRAVLQKVIKVVYNAFALIEYKTGLNPIQVLVHAKIHVAPR